MLIQFKVENYKSFKGEAILSMEASTDKEHGENIIAVDNNRLLNSVAIFGANAAGKSNLFQALTAGILAVKHSNTRQVNQPIPGVVPFKFDEKSEADGTSFEFVFIEGGIKYIYRFKVTAKEVLSEMLIAYKTKKPTVIFDRDERRNPVYKFTNSSIRKELNPITTRNTKNKMFLATATEWNCKETEIPFGFFQSGINTYSSDYAHELNTVGMMLDNDNDGSIKSFIKKTIKAADINIEDFEFDSKELNKDEFFAGIPTHIRQFINYDENAVNKQYSLRTNRTVKKDSGEKKYSLDILEESEGTRALFVISPILKRAFERGETVCIDEMDKSLHPALVIFLVRCFSDPSLNINRAQLVMSSHTTSLLSLDILRRDQIYFVDKDQATCESDLYSLDEFSARKTEDVQKAYLLGRYGAVPEIYSGGF